MNDVIGDYDTGFRFGTFDKCNGHEPRFDRSYIETDIEVGGYFDAYDANEVKING